MTKQTSRKNAERADTAKHQASAKKDSPNRKKDTENLTTEGPLSEKDEVKKAEARTQKAASKHRH